MTEEKVLKALTSDTRRKIIKVLSNGYRNPSDLSRMVNKSKSTIVEHLDKLVGAGLVSRMDRPGKKWVFYKLTNKGRKLTSDNSQKIVVILSFISLFALVSGSFTFYRYSTYYGATGISSTKTEVIGHDVLDQPKPSTTNSVAKNYLFHISLISITISIISIAGVFYVKNSRMRGVLK